MFPKLQSYLFCTPKAPAKAARLRRRKGCSGAGSGAGAKAGSGAGALRIWFGKTWRFWYQSLGYPGSPELLEPANLKLETT